jgi:hypothetical protein
MDYPDCLGLCCLDYLLGFHLAGEEVQKVNFMSIVGGV